MTSIRAFAAGLSLLAVTATAQSARYTDANGRFTLEHPAAWTAQENPAGVVLSSPDQKATLSIAPIAPEEGVPLEDIADGYESIVRRGRPGARIQVVADQPLTLGGRPAHGRTLRLTADDGPDIRLDMLVLRGAESVLIATAACPESLLRTHTATFERMLASLAGAAPKPDRDAIERKLRALDSAREAGVLDDEEHARKKAELLAALEAASPEPDPETERKLAALLAARDAGVLTAEEYEAKRAALQPATAADPEQPKPKGREGKIYRHPIGFSLWHPTGWRVQEQEDFLQLLPPDPAVEDGDPLELYFVIGDTVEGTGITRPDDPQVLTYLDEQVRSIVATLRRSGRPTPVPTAKGAGVSVDWKAKTPDGRDLLARCFIAIVADHGVALLALGLPDKIAPRDPELRAIFASFGIGEGDRDPALVGSWVLVSTSSIRNESPFETDWSRARAVGETKSQLTLGADGTYEQIDDWHMIAISGGVSLEDKDRKVTRGKWCAGEGQLYLVSTDQTWTDSRYQLRRGPGGPELRLVTGTRGEIWRPAK